MAAAAPATAAPDPAPVTVAPELNPITKYEIAKSKKYRFFSYGDSMLILK